VGARRDDTGAAAVEFAIVVVLLLLLVFGITEFGLGFFQAQGANAGVREAARRAAVGQIATCSTGTGASDLKGIVSGAASGVTFGTPKMTTSNDNGNTITGDAGDTVTVTVPYTVDLSIVSGFVPGISSSLANTATAQARVEQQGGVSSC
jgi:Flp pilus assembly protein TadG